MQSDFYILLDVERVADNAHRESYQSKLPMRHLPSHLKQLIYQCRIRDVSLQIMPLSFQRRKENTTYYSGRDKHMYWHVEWIFHPDGGVKIYDPKVCETVCLNQVSDHF